MSTFQDHSDSTVDCLTKGCNKAREYCVGTVHACQAAASETECYNATAMKFQEGCDAGFKCIDDLCRVDADPVDHRECHIICSAGKFCEDGTTTCRGPRYKGECFDLETGSFQKGCGEGYFCSFNKCVDISLDD
uniref:Cysteine-rich protein n=1 Tax=Hyaloperonospora arabidopsidis (strain Emoy2) TaxID=559515 RepID=M4BPZ6_HYAAE